MRKYLLPGAFAVLALAACGGSDHAVVPMTPPPPAPVSEPPVVVNMFTQSVTAVAAAVTEAAEPDAVDMYSLSLPDDTEPTPIQGG